MPEWIANALQLKIDTANAVVGVIGLGYVGLPLLSTLHAGGLPVVGFDIDRSKIEMLGRGETYLKHLGHEMTTTLAQSSRAQFTTDFSRLVECDVVIVCVPTPLGSHREPDLSFVLKSAESIGRCLRQGQLLILESTTYPGTTREEFLPEILRSAQAQGLPELTVGIDFFVAFSPEREDPGRKDHSTATIPKLVGGLDSQSTALAAALYRKGVKSVVEVSDADVAEAAKLLENIFRAVNIALVNEMKMVLSELGVDIWEVIRAASTKPFGFMPFYPGPGLGGHCIPIDPFYLTWKAKEVGLSTKFIELAGEINTEMPAWVVRKTLLALNQAGLAMSRARILVVGLAYKPDVDDSRESPSFEIIERLLELGATVDYHDPFIPVAPVVRKHNLALTSVDLDRESIERYDCVLIATHHSFVDWSLIAEHAKLIVDTRDVMRPFTAARGRVTAA